MSTKALATNGSWGADICSDNKLHWLFLLNKCSRIILIHVWKYWFNRQSGMKTISHLRTTLLKKTKQKGKKSLSKRMPMDFYNDLEVHQISHEPKNFLFFRRPPQVSSDIHVRWRRGTKGEQGENFNESSYCRFLKW